MSNRTLISDIPYNPRICVIGESRGGSTATLYYIREIFKNVHSIVDEPHHPEDNNFDPRFNTRINLETLRSKNAPHIVKDHWSHLPYWSDRDWNDYYKHYTVIHIKRNDFQQMIFSQAISQYSDNWNSTPNFETYSLPPQYIKYAWRIKAKDTSIRLKLEPHFRVDYTYSYEDIKHTLSRIKSTRPRPSKESVLENYNELLELYNSLRETHNNNPHYSFIVDKYNRVIPKP